jgi:hypothetical protein
MKRKMTIIGLIVSAVLMHMNQVNAQCAIKGEHDHSAHAKKLVVEEKILTVGKNVAFIKLSQIKEAKKVILQILQKDKKTALAITKAPRLNLIVDNKNKQVKTVAVAVADDKSKYIAENAVFSKDLKGKISIKINGTKYLVSINPHAHGEKCNH